MTSELTVLNYPYLYLRSGCIYNILLSFIKSCCVIGIDHVCCSHSLDTASVTLAAK